MAKAIQDFLGKGVRVLKKDSSGIIAFYKPEGIKSHPNEKSMDAKSLLKLQYDEGVEAYLADDGKPLLYLLHRLDSPTSGVLLASTSEQMAHRIKKLFKERKVKKIYYAVVKGPVRLNRSIWSDLLGKVKKDAHIRAKAGQGSMAKTKVALVKQGKYALLKLEPITGKSHQLRIQCAQRGCPILGDKTYGDFKLNKQFSLDSGMNRLMLHAYSISIKDNEFSFNVNVPVPAEWEMC